MLFALGCCAWSCAFLVFPRLLCMVLCFSCCSWVAVHGLVLFLFLLGCCAWFCAFLVAPGLLFVVLCLFGFFSLSFLFFRFWFGVCWLFGLCLLFLGSFLGFCFLIGCSAYKVDEFLIKLILYMNFFLDFSCFLW